MGFFVQNDTLVFSSVASNHVLLQVEDSIDEKSEAPRPDDKNVFFLSIFH